MARKHIIAWWLPALLATTSIQAQLAPAVPNADTPANSAPLLAQTGGPAVVEGATATGPKKSGTTWWDAFKDPMDGDVDMSRWLLQHKGALLVPIIITEPAVGTGGGLAAVFFHRPAQSEESRERGEVLPPDIYGIGGFKTENGTWGTGLGGKFHFKDDSWRYAALIGKASVNLDFYTQGVLAEPHKIGYNLDGVFAYQQLSRRFGRSNWFASARWIYMDLDSRLNLQSNNQYFTPKDFAQRASGLGLGLNYESLDNTLSPSKGLEWEAVGTAYAPAFGSDNTFQTYRTHMYGYIPFASSWVLALRGDVRAARGDTPFYQLPSIDLRGISYGRYQDENVGMVEAELRWNLTSRWVLLGFGGAGRAWGRHVDFGDASTHATEGVGFRYLIARALGLYAGLDVARSEDDHAFYIQVGSAWR